jgi:hypothetical protein
MDEINQAQQIPNQQAPQPSPNSFPDAIDLFKHAWGRYRAHAKKYIVILAPLFIVAFMLGLIGQANAETDSFSAMVLSLSVIAAIVGIMAEIAVIYSIMTEDREVTVAEAYRKSTSIFWSFLLVQLLVGIIVSLGFIVFIIPGIYLAIRYSFAAFAVIGENKRGMDALNRSRDLVRGRWWEVFIRLIFILILSLVPFAIFFFISPSSVAGQILQNALSLMLAPFWILYIYGLYKALKSSTLQIPNN